jgi:NAD(P)-dependent dehydrogenase (short-subunit alcohol dehydrogenase family)
MEFRDAVTVITGGGSGIGRSLALALAGEGADIVVADLDQQAAGSVADEVRAVGRRALAVRVDVAREAEIQALVQQALAEFGRIDCFVSNAGVVLDGPVEEVTDADWQWIMGINFYAHVYAIRAVLPHMLARNSGYLVHTASAAGLIETGGSIPYHVSKHAVVALAEGLAIDLRVRGSDVQASVVCPELVNTNLPLRSFNAGEIGKEMTAAERAAHAEEVEASRAWMAQRGLSPDDAARAIVAGMRDGRVRIYTHQRTHDIVAHRAANPEQAIRDATGVLQRQHERLEKLAAQAKTRE